MFLNLFFCWFICGEMRGKNGFLEGALRLTRNAPAFRYLFLNGPF
jgi:hypothetical protein